MLEQTNENWDWEIKTQTNWWGSSLADIWSYRHLLAGFVRRDFLLGYQQTVLGPLWVLLQPIITMITYVIVFSKVVGISTGGVPPTLFYLAGIILWNLFNDSFTSISATFRDNANIFSKVYFPRLIVPFAQLSGFLIRFAIQFLFLLLLLSYYMIFTTWQLQSIKWMLLLPIVVALVSIQSLALGLLFSILTGKYRDVSFVVGLGVRLLMFLTPVLYPVQYVEKEWQWIVQINPLTSLFELFRWILFGQAIVTLGQLFYSISFTIILLIVALLTFNKQGSKIIDVL